MSTEVMKYLIFGLIGLFAIILVAYFMLNKRLNGADKKYERQLRAGTNVSKFSLEILYQKLYVMYAKIPFLKRYLRKIRRRMELINIEDEYNTRKNTSKVMTKALGIVIVLTIGIIVIANSNPLLLVMLLMLELFITETLVEASVDKIDNNLLKEQVDFFSEIRHAYNETNMVEEAIYQVSLDEEKAVSRQAEKIYEVLISDDPEGELEKYYDVAPNSYLKEFAGVSYLTKEFGDRKVNGASLYLKNLNNITKEMQIEILKRDKFDYVFQILSIIAAVPMLLIEPLKRWSISNLAFTEEFYNGKGGLIVMVILLILTAICYYMIRNIKDITKSNVETNMNPWQKKLYKNPIVKRIVNLFIPKQGSKEYQKLTKTMKDAASKQKIEYFYINKLVLCITAFVITFALSLALHKTAIDYVYTDLKSVGDEYNVMGSMSDKDKMKAQKILDQDNKFLESLKNKVDTSDKTKAMKVIRNEVKYSRFYKDATDEEIDTVAERIFTKLQTIKSEVLQWFELLVSIVVALVGYMLPNWLLFFQMKMRQLEMEDEVMQFQTIILMLMRIERVNVEIILEWLERYSNIFRGPISKCVNNYEAGAWEALEDMRNDVTYMPFIRLVESMQAAVEKIPIKDAFEELETERDYYQEKRKESNERLISKKGMIGKFIGFTPMVVLFVGYLIIPMMVMGVLSIAGTLSQLSAM